MALIEPRITAAICARTWTKIARRPVILVFSLVQPLMWMIFFGFLFHRYDVQDLGSHARYLDFLLPGVCVMTVLFGSSQAGTALIRDVQTGFLRRILLTSASPASVLAGKILADVIRLLAQAVVVGAMGCLMGARLNAGLSPVLTAIALLTLFAVGYASLSCWIALKTRSQETMGVFIQAVNMPLLFTSTVLVPHRHMPAWLASLAAWNPISLVADTLRFALLGMGTGASPFRLAGAGAAGLILFALCVREMGKARRT